jgi:hypothetical protein
MDNLFIEWKNLFRKSKIHSRIVLPYSAWRDREETSSLEPVCSEAMKKGNSMTRGALQKLHAQPW